MFLFHTAQKSYLKHKTQADLTLNKVFKECNQTPNSISVDRLLLNNKLSTKGYNGCLIIAIVVFVLTLIMPLSFYPYQNQRLTKADIDIIDHNVVDQTFYLKLDGDFIDYSSIYAMDKESNVILPISYDAKTGYVVFPYDEVELNIFLYDYNQNVKQLLLSPHNS